ncbi:hypothetical protein D3C76_231930 [compost metagenome]
MARAVECDAANFGICLALEVKYTSDIRASNAGASLILNLDPIDVTGINIERRTCAFSHQVDAVTGIGVLQIDFPAISSQYCIYSSAGSIRDSDVEVIAVNLTVRAGCDNGMGGRLRVSRNEGS